MKTAILRKLALGLSVFIFLFILTQLIHAGKPRSKEITVRVAVKTNVPLTQDIVDELAQYGQVNHVLWRLNLVDMQVTESGKASLQASPQVQFVEPDMLVPIHLSSAPGSDLPTNFSAGLPLWHHDMSNFADLDPDPLTRCNGQVVPGTENRCVSETGRGIYVAVLDTGLIHKWRELFPEDRIDQVHAATFMTQNVNFPQAWDHDTSPDQHGTQVVGHIIGFHASDPSLPFPLFPADVTAVAPEATIIPINVTRPDIETSILDLLAAVEYVADLPGILQAEGVVKPRVVMNASHGFWPHEFQAQGVLLQSYLDALDDAIAHDVIVVGVSLNCGPIPWGAFSSVGDNPCTPLMKESIPFPGAYSPVITVGASGWKENWLLNGEPEPILGNWLTEVDVPEEAGLGMSDASYVPTYSQRPGPGQSQDILDLVAPVTWVLTTKDANLTHGTSLAAPMVAGAVALLLEKAEGLGITLRQGEVEAILRKSALKIQGGEGYQLPPVPPFPEGEQSSGPWDSQDAGEGVLQVDRALDCLDEQGVKPSCLNP